MRGLLVAILIGCGTKAGDAPSTPKCDGQEVCDGADNDCDGEVDEGVTREFFADADADGHGDAAEGAVACTAPAGAVTTDDDCDDQRSDVHPEMAEACDGIDNDCDAVADEDLSTTDWHADTDGDGFGDETGLVASCAQPEGFVADATDCDDADAATHPGAVDRCANGIDENCDGQLEGCAIALDGADFELRGTTEYQCVGCRLATADLNGDGVDDLLAGSPGASGDPPGKAYVVYGPAAGVWDAADAHVTISTQHRGAWLGMGIGGGDADADGVTDLLVGAAGMNGAGAAYLFRGPVESARVDDADVALFAATDGAWAGQQTLVVPDGDGDGNADLVVAAPTIGTFYVISGVVTSAVSLESAATYTYVGETGGYAQACAEGLGDTNGDGIEDLAFGYGTRGGVYLVEGGAAAGSHELDDAAVAMFSPHDGLYSVPSCAGADYDGDGRVDLFVGSVLAPNPPDPTAGHVYAFLGPFDGDLASEDAVTIWSDPTKDPNDYSGFGYAIAAGGDVDGDGATDVLLDCSSCGSTGSGMAWLQYGFAPGVVDPESLAVFDNPAVPGGLEDLAFLGDWTEDGASELAVSAWDGRTGMGTVYVMTSDQIR